jgi:ATP-dependent Clp protease protease subunit
MGVQGQATDVDIAAKEILKLRSKLNELLAAETGAGVAKIAEDTRRDYWMSAEEAREYGLITTIVAGVSSLPS